MKLVTCGALILASNFLFTSTQLQAHSYCDSPTAQSVNSAIKGKASYLKSDISGYHVLSPTQVLTPGVHGQQSRFGAYIELIGDTLFVTSLNNFGDYHGSVDIFEFQNNEWQHSKSLKSPNQQLSENVSIIASDGNTLLMGANNYCQGGPCEGWGQGTVYVFERNHGGQNNWGFIQQLDGGYKSEARFGINMSVEGDLAVMRSLETPSNSALNGVVYIFEKNALEPGKWGLVKRIESTSSWHIGQDSHGTGFFIRGNTLLVNGHDFSGIVIREFGRDVGGSNNWGLAGEISIPDLHVRSSHFDGATLMLGVIDRCLPYEDQTSHLLFYGKEAGGAWSKHQEIANGINFRQVVVDGNQALVTVQDSTDSFILHRGPSLESWEFTTQLDPSVELIPPLASTPSLDSDRAVIGWSYDVNGEGLALSYDLSKPINAGHAGAWFNPETAGQGQLIDVEPDSQFLFLSWFTYTPADSDHPFEQHWYTAQGNYAGSEAELIVYETLDGKFDDPQAVTTEPVGSATLTFTDCGHGQMNYTIDTLGLSGSFPLQRAIAGSENLCQQKSSNNTQAVDINGGMDGAWFDENTPGQGFLIDAHPDPEGGNFMFVAWFTFGDDTASGQRWLTAQGSFEGSTAAIDVYETKGGSFDDPQAVSTDPVGTMTIDFQDCGNALLSYELTDEALSNSVSIRRAIPGAEALCEELAVAE